MFLIKIKIFLIFSFYTIIFVCINNNIKSSEITILSGKAIVIDGDTIKIDKKKIRLLGIDAPEKDQLCKKPWLNISFLSFEKKYFCGELATKKLKDLINNKFVSCKTINRDKYKRYIAECFKDRININSWMVQKGYAVAYRRYSKKFIVQENIAKKNNSGIWVGSFEMPWEYRKKN